VGKALFEVSTLSGIVYLFYCAFGVCILMNVVMSVVINKALEDANAEKTNFMISDSSATKAHVETVQKIFHGADKDGDGVLEKNEFEVLFYNPCVEQYFKHLGLDYEAWQPDRLFEMLDYDNQGTICIDEFVYACSVLKGSAQRLDLARSFESLNKKIIQLSDITMEQRQDMAVFRAELNTGMQQHKDITLLRTELNKMAHSNGTATCAKDVSFRQDNSVLTDTNASIGPVCKGRKEPTTGTISTLTL
jgi:Ca2+-binding EF-hand superfamily protein